MTEPHHLSKLLLDRYLTGELSPEEASRVESRFDDRARQHLDAVKLARAGMPQLDIAALRARADALEVEDTAEEEPVDLDAYRRSRLTTVLSGLLLAAAALFAVFAFSSIDPETSEPASYAVRGSELTVHVAEGGELHPYEPGTAVGAGDVLGFKVLAGEHRGVVLLSVDGTGMVSVFFPAEGVEPEPLAGPGQVELPGTVMLDGAPGPEVFVAVFDQPADQAKALVRETYWARGHEGLRELGVRPDIAVAEVERR